MAPGISIKCLCLDWVFYEIYNQCTKYNQYLTSIIYFRFIYQYCENVSERPVANKPNASEIQFETKSWCPVDLNLQEIAHALIEKVKPQ